MAKKVTTFILSQFPLIFQNVALSNCFVKTDPISHSQHSIRLPQYPTITVSQDLQYNPPGFRRMYAEQTPNIFYQILPRVPRVLGQREAQQRRAERAVRGRGVQEVAALPPLPLLRHLPPQLRQRDHEQEGRHRHRQDAGMEKGTI